MAKTENARLAAGASAGLLIAMILSLLYILRTAGIRRALWPAVMWLFPAIYLCLRLAAALKALTY